MLKKSIAIPALALIVALISAIGWHRPDLEKTQAPAPKILGKAQPDDAGPAADRAARIAAAQEAAKAAMAARAAIPPSGVAQRTPWSEPDAQASAASGVAAVRRRDERRRTDAAASDAAAQAMQLAIEAARKR